MTRPPLSERRRTHTRREIAESAVTLFARDGYDNVSVEDISEEEIGRASCRERVYSGV